MKITDSKMFRAQVAELLKMNEFEDQILNLSEKAFNSGAMDIENIDDSDFSDCKAFMFAALSSLSFQYRPFSKEKMNTAKNLQSII